MNYNGYMGKILHVDLTNMKTEIEQLDLDAARKYLGGRGLGIWLLTRHCKQGLDPLGEDNALIFCTGPYTGSGVFSAFYNVTTNSPLTGLAASCHSGGSWGPMLKRSGYDVIIVRGTAEKPCFILSLNDMVKILPADKLWGKGVKDTQKLMLEEYGKVAVVAIGPGGENLVKYASIMNDVYRAAGRGGVGAVMGAKKLKAVVVGGDQKIQYANRQAFMELSRMAAKNSLAQGAKFSKYGTTSMVSLMNERGTLSSYNYRGGHYKDAALVDGDALKRQYFVRDVGCYNCPMKCANIHTVPEGPYKVEETEGPEFETIGVFGPNCGNSNLASIIKASDMCNDLGIDTITTGNTIALVFDLYEKGLVDKGFCDGLDLSWGNSDSILKLIELIGRKKGCGALLAEGSLKVAQHFGSENSSIQIQGQEFPAYEVRRAHGVAISFATSNRGACHLRGCMYVDEIIAATLDPYGFSDEKIKILIEKENLLAVVDSLVMCKFGQRYGKFTPDVLTQVLNHLTGIDFSEQELYQIGERTYNLERLYNSYGERKYATLPDRLFNEDCDDGMKGGKRLSREEFDAAVDKYYARREWNAQGKPTQQKLSKLNIEF